MCYVVIEREHVKKSEMQISTNSEACGAMSAICDYAYGVLPQFPKPVK